ncbi:MAG: hypothetical protein HY615_11695 [Candidatus Rokubacteria bacterium]|nr:hypothetical protein [Candidatus Rokubacteria bacterium]
MNEGHQRPETDPKQPFAALAAALDRAARDLAPGAEPSTFVVVLETGPTVLRLGHGYEPAAGWRRRRPPLA